MKLNKRWLAATALMLIACVCATPLRKTFEAAFAHSSATREAVRAPGDWYEPIPLPGSQAPIPPVVLGISGEIYGLAPNAALDSVLVRVGNRSFAAQVQGGSYTASIDALDPSEMVSVEVVGERVRYRSILGSFSKLMLRSGGDRRVEAVELPTLRVSPWSSALAFMVKVALGRDAASDQEFERASRTLSGHDLFNANHLLGGAASGLVPLPSGYADGQQFLEDQVAYRSWVEALPALPANAEAAWSQADYAPLPSLHAVPEQVLMMPPMPLNGFPVSPEAPQLMLRNIAGSYDLYDGEAEVARPSYTPQVDASGDLVLLPNSQRVIHEFEGTTRVQRTLERIVFRRLFDGDRYDLWAMRAKWTRTYPDDPSIPPIVDAPVTLWSVSDLDTVARSHSWIAAPTRRALPFLCAKPVPQPGVGYKMAHCDVVLHRFDFGGLGATEDHGPKVGTNMVPTTFSRWIMDISWSVVGPELRLRVADKTLRLWSVDGDDLADTVVYVATGVYAWVDGQTMAGVSGSLAADAVPLPNPQALGNWSTGAALAMPTAYPSPNYTLEIQRYSDRSGQVREYDQENGASFSSMRWETQWERVYDIRSRADFGATGGIRDVRDCTAAFASGAQTCAPTYLRYFRPLKRVGDRLYGIEELHSQSMLTPPGYMGGYEITTTIRPNFHQCTSGACLSLSPERLPATPVVVESRPATPILAVVRPGKTRTAMPIYAFQCSACGHSFDRLQKLSDADPSLCPSCGAEAVSRQLTAPQFRLAGGGWYETDFKKDGDKKRNLADAAGSSGSDKPKPAESKTETKAEPAKSEPKPAAKPAASSD